MAKSKDDRTRNWVFIVYPESAPEDWLEILDQMNVEMCISPLHDKDINGDGSPKKPHYHVLACFESNKSYNQVKEITDLLNAPIPQKAKSVKGSARYWVHMDNPEKAQYNIKDIKALSGFDLTEALKPSSADRYSIIKDMIEYIQDNQITEFEDILIYSMNNKFDTWFPLLCDNSAFIISKVVDSKRNRLRETGCILDGQQLVDVETGEIVSDKSHLFDSDKEEPEQPSNDKE